MLERIRKFFQGPPGPPGPTGAMGMLDPQQTYTHCNMCTLLARCTRIGQHYICTHCEMKMFERIKLILKFE
jgi:hypothetical protein